MSENLLKFIENECFNDYRKEVENMDKTYIELISYMNNTIPYLEKLTIINQFILKDIINILLNNENININNFIDQIEKSITEVDNYFIDKKDVLLKKVKDKHKNQEIVQKADKILDKQIEKADAVFDKDEEKIFEVIVDEIRLLEVDELKKIFEEKLNTTERKDFFNKNLEKLVEEAKNSKTKSKTRKFVNQLLNLLKDSFDNINIDTEEEEREKKLPQSITEMFVLLRNKKIFTVTYKTIRHKQKDLDNVLEEITNKVGKSLPGSEAEAQLNIAKKAFIGYITILVSLSISQGVVAYIQTIEKEEKDLDEEISEDHIRLNNLNKIMNEEVYLEILQIATSAVRAAASFVPTGLIKRFFKFNKNLFMKLITVTSFAELIKSPASFIKETRGFFKSIQSNPEQLDTMFQQYNIELRHLDELAMIDDIPQEAFKVAMQSSIRVIRQRQKLMKIATQIMKEYGVRQTWSAEMGEKARKGVEKIKDSFGRSDDKEAVAEIQQETDTDVER